MTSWSDVLYKQVIGYRAWLMLGFRQRSHWFPNLVQKGARISECADPKVVHLKFERPETKHSLPRKGPYSELGQDKSKHAQR